MNKRQSVYGTTYEAIDSCRRLKKTWERENNPQAAQYCNLIGSLLLASEKFAVDVSNDFYFLKEKDFDVKLLELLKLPFPINTFEIKWDREQVIEKDINGRLTKLLPDKSIAIAASWKYLDKNKMLPPLWKKCIKLAGTSNLINDKSMLFAAMIKDSVTKLWAAPTPFIFFDGVGVMSQKEEGKLQMLPISIEMMIAIADKKFTVEQMYKDISDELLFLRSFLMLINCSNVSHRKEKIKPLCKKRFIKRLNEPFTYRVVDIKNPIQNVNESEYPSHRASPRLHLRRGHIRHYESGLLKWIEPFFVGARDNGTVVKDYIY